MKFFVSLMMALVMMMGATGCQSAKYKAYSLAVAFVSEYKLVVKSDGGVECQSDGIYGYAEGSGNVLVGIWSKTDNAWVWHATKAGAISQGYKMEWDFEAGKPAIRNTTVGEAKASLGAVPQG